MARERKPPSPPPDDPPRDAAPDSEAAGQEEIELVESAGERTAERRSGPLETLFQEAVRRAAGLGFSSFFSTEEAVRRALADHAPKDWTDFVVRQGDELRAQVVERVTHEFADWLRTLDANALAEDLLAQYEFNVNVKISASPRKTPQESPLQVVPRRK